MPAPFTVDLCGYRVGGNPNTSDNNDSQSKYLGTALFEVLGVPAGQPAPDDAGAALETAVRDHLASIRPDLNVRRSRPASDFEQYGHMAVFPTFRRAHIPSDATVKRLATAIENHVPEGERAAVQELLRHLRVDLQFQDSLVAELVSHMPEEALLKLDITVAEPRPEGSPLLHAALSSKWSLRTDRAQDCVSQGSKLVSQRRGRMPHFAVVTMEPRPAMLKILGDGSGAVDCVYHLDLPALQTAMEELAAQQPKPEAWSPMRTFTRLVRQRRLRDFDDLVEEVLRLPGGRVRQ